ncbi:MAG: hypothetical protein ACI8QC_003245 [Planctomycetota bacterium]|jgi:hypothetical protein
MNRYAIQGFGPLGQKLAREIHQRGDQLVAVIDLAEELQGASVSELLNLDLGELCVSPSLASSNLQRADLDAALVTTGSDFSVVAGCLEDWIERGIPAVSSCEEMLWPWLRHPECAAALDGKAQSAGVALCASGVNPGFVMDLLPLFLSSACRKVERVHIARIQDARPRRIPFQRKIGAALSPADFAKRAATGSLRHVGLLESMHLLAHHLGFELDSWDEQLEPVWAEVDMHCDLGPIPAGHARGVRQVGVGLEQGKEVVRLEFQAAIDQADPADRVQLFGEPDLELIIPGAVPGDDATSSMLLATARALATAPAGLRTPADLVLPRWHN